MVTPKKGATKAVRLTPDDAVRYEEFANSLRVTLSDVLRILLDLATNDEVVYKKLEGRARELAESRLEYDFEMHMVEIQSKHPSSSPEIDLDGTEKVIESEGYFNPASLEDAREKVERAIVQRRGQPRFRKQLLEAYQGKCAVTGCDVEAALEAAHIIPYKGAETDQVGNGLLLRADIHTLFDLYLITVDPATKQIRIAPELKGSTYGEIEGKQLELPQDKTLRPR
ncbi:hypothetical protein Cri9333_2755 [Crinalium epipsammum PCC 9333]|uniref:HNH nuclease domain-containing protein n=1 Tax=Crinalium epipsammum PCC 9333 TaxID=1173022 RepID=K9W2H0_9CYAN|nr:HNH endonuclease [Crinalium epipsammum]AFZ13605.1 hypothetical protein Cri9333_2755 [Crinalium epipsammum PCC 9333]